MTPVYFLSALITAAGAAEGHEGRRQVLVFSTVFPATGLHSDVLSYLDLDGANWEEKLLRT